MHARTIIVTLAALGAAACETVESGEIRTAALRADITVFADGSGASTVQAVLRPGGAVSNTFLELTGGDRLVASSDGRRRTMVPRHGLFDEVFYVADFEGDAADTRFRVAFERPSGVGEDAPDSWVDLPAPFRLTAPAAGDLLRPAAEPLRVAWDARAVDAVDPVEVVIEGSCIERFSRRFATDPGALVLAPGELVTQGDRSCNVTIEVARVRAGWLDPAFGRGGRVEARQVRSTHVVVRPEAPTDDA